MLEVNVKDTGKGIKENDQKKVFLIIKDEDSISLGLSLCKQIANKNDGIVRFNSKYLEGSNFFFSFKLEEFNKEGDRFMIDTFTTMLAANSAPKKRETEAT